MSTYYDRDGNAISAEEWSRTYTPDKQRVALTEINDDVSVSTVWLGIDHNWGHGRPIIFETMIFGGPLDQEQWRYSTETEALAGHEKAVEQARMAVHAGFGEAKA